MTVAPPLYGGGVEYGASPWHVLRERDDIVLEYGWLRGCKGRTIDHGSFFAITLDCRLTQVERRCVLAHELVHVGRRIFYDRTTSPRLVAKEEAMVDRAVARWLVPVPKLERLIHRLESLGEPVTVEAVQERFRVTPKLAEQALALLRSDHERRAS